MKVNIPLQESLTIEELNEIRYALSLEYDIPLEEIPNLDILEGINIDSLDISIAPKGFDNPIANTAKKELYSYMNDLYEWQSIMEQIRFIEDYEKGCLREKSNNNDYYEYYKENIEEFLYKNNLSMEEFLEKYFDKEEFLENKIKELKKIEKTYSTELRIYGLDALIDNIKIDTIREVVKFKRDREKMRIDLKEKDIKSLEYERKESNGDLIMCGSSVIKISDNPKESLKQVLNAIKLTDEKVNEKMSITIDSLKNDLFKNNFRESLQDLENKSLEL